LRLIAANNNYWWSRSCGPTTCGGKLPAGKNKFVTFFPALIPRHLPRNLLILKPVSASKIRLRQWLSNFPRWSLGRLRFHGLALLYAMKRCSERVNTIKPRQLAARHVQPLQVKRRAMETLHDFIAVFLNRCEFEKT
jgi:hypothetical protein